MNSYETEVASDIDLSTKEKLDIESLVKAKLMPLPASATRVLGMIEDVNITSHELAEGICYDPVLASRVMRLANSPLYAMQREVSTVHAAVAAVGIRAIYDIVMLGIAAETFSTDMRSVKTGVSIWEHSVATALASRAIARDLGLRGTEEAFTCGLLHDIGKNLLYQTDPLRYTELEFAENEYEASAMEEEFFGFNHSEVGYIVSQRWGLADPVSASILCHHNPKTAPQAVAVTHIVSLADDLVTKKGMGLHLEDSEVIPPMVSADVLGIGKEDIERAWLETSASLDEILVNF